MAQIQKSKQHLLQGEEHAKSFFSSHSICLQVNKDGQQSFLDYSSNYQ